MAKGIITRQIKYLPANPAGRYHHIDISLIESVDIVNFPLGKSYKALMNGKTRIQLTSGNYRYSCESVKEINRAIMEASK